MVLWVLSVNFFTPYVGNYIVAPAISFEVAVISNFSFSYFWIWRERIQARGLKTFVKRFIIFNISCVVGFIVKMVFLLLFERLFGWNVVYCNLSALIISGIANFFLADLVVFKKRLAIANPISCIESMDCFSSKLTIDK